MNPKVSIVMMVYNHGRFLRQALDSVLMQQTDFDYELIVGEDCSPDDSREILREYAPKFGQRLVPLYREKNMGAVKNLLDCLNRCRGDYLAVLEGDDFWTDARKLQTQVDFLESHDDYSAVYHRCRMVNQNNECLKDVGEWDGFHDYSVQDYELGKLPSQTGTILVRGKVLRDCIHLASARLKRYLWIPMDRLAPLLLLRSGKVGILPENMSAYRYFTEEGGTNWSSQHGEKAVFAPLYYSWIMRGTEHFAGAIGYRLDFSRMRMYEFRLAMVRRNWEGCSKPKQLLQAGLILLMEPHPIRFWKTYQQIKNDIEL